MTQTLLLVVLFVAAIGSLPWLIRKLQQRRGETSGLAAGAPRVISAVAVGPHQRVVTVEVGPSDERVVLVLGVTPQQIECLHKFRAPSDPEEHSRPSFMSEMAQVGAPTHREPVWTAV